MVYHSLIPETSIENSISPVQCSLFSFIQASDEKKVFYFSFFSLLLLSFFSFSFYARRSCISWNTFFFFCFFEHTSIDYRTFLTRNFPSFPPFFLDFLYPLVAWCSYYLNLEKLSVTMAAGLVVKIVDSSRLTHTRIYPHVGLKWGCVLKVVWDRGGVQCVHIYLGWPYTDKNISVILAHCVCWLFVIFTRWRPLFSYAVSSEYWKWTYRCTAIFAQWWYKSKFEPFRLFPYLCLHLKDGIVRWTYLNSHTRLDDLVEKFRLSLRLPSSFFSSSVLLFYCKNNLARAPFKFGQGNFYFLYLVLKLESYGYWDILHFYLFLCLGF